VIDAQEEIASLSLAQSAMVIESAWIYIHEGRRDLSHQEIIGASFVSEVYKKYPNIPARIFESDEFALQELREQGDLNENSVEGLQRLVDRAHFSFQPHSQLIEFNYKFHVALISLMYEGMARLKYDQDEVKWYAFNLLKDEEIKIATKFECIEIKSHFVANLSRRLPRL
jgi:hypothetical protein